MTTKPKTTPKQELKNSKAKKAYAFWLLNINLNRIEVADRHGLTENELRYWMDTNDKKSPSIHLRGKNSDRQACIKSAYHEAVKQGKDLVWAEKYARDGGATSVKRADIRYFAMKNNLPDLPEPNGYRLSPIPPISL
jgi:hypothetical protein